MSKKFYALVYEQTQKKSVKKQLCQAFISALHLCKWHTHNLSIDTQLSLKIDKTKDTFYKVQQKHREGEYQMREGWIPPLTDAAAQNQTLMVIDLDLFSC